MSPCATGIYPWCGWTSEKTEEEVYDETIYEFWTGHGRRPAKFNYSQVHRALSMWKLKQSNDTGLLHMLRHAYYPSHHYDNFELVWPGKLKSHHRPLLSCPEYDIEFECKNGVWVATKKIKK